MRRLLTAMLTTTAAACFATSASAALLFSDSFDHPDTTNYDATSPQDPSQEGLLAGAIEFRSSKSTLDIAGNQLLMPSGTAPIRIPAGGSTTRATLLPATTLRPRWPLSAARVR